MWTIYNCESVGSSFAIGKEWQNQISWQSGTIPFGDGLNFDLLFRFINVERNIWTSSLQSFFQEG